MSEKWTLEKINQLIINQEQENLNLEYKSSGALEKTDKKREEITKDVSAMANSDGGTIIYGIKEYDETEKRHLPEKIDAIDQSKTTKEWLEQVIITIRPKIDGIIITPISVDSGNAAVYVVDIPKSNTAHQSKNKRYYKRYNFESEPMEDYEIRDVMSRNQYPKFELSFQIKKLVRYYSSGKEFISLPNSMPQVKDVIKEDVNYTLYINAKNIGSIYAQYVNALFLIPYFILDYEIDEDEQIKDDDICYCKYYEDNTVRDIVKYDYRNSQYGSARYVPILPGLSQTWVIQLKNLGEVLPTGRFNEKHKLKWTIYADNAIPQTGEIHLAEIDIKDKKESS